MILAVLNVKLKTENINRTIVSFFIIISFFLVFLLRFPMFKNTLNESTRTREKEKKRRIIYAICVYDTIDVGPLYIHYILSTLVRNKFIDVIQSEVDEVFFFLSYFIGLPYVVDSWFSHDIRMVYLL